MGQRGLIFAAVLLVACGLIVAGAALLHPSAGLVVGGLLLIGWSYLVLGEQ